MICVCGSVLVSVKHNGYREWTCPHLEQPFYGPHSQPFLDRRLAVVQRPQLPKPEGKPGPKGLPGSRARRQPWNRGRVRPGTLAEWSKHNYQLGRPQQMRGNDWRFIGRTSSTSFTAGGRTHSAGAGSLFIRPFETNKPRGRRDRWEREALNP
jgi:hypothetical protein